MGLYTIDSKYNIMTLEESKIKLDEISDDFTEFLIKLVNITGFKKIRLVGIGNSITAGWTTLDNNVMPLIDKYQAFVLNKTISRKLNFEIASFPLVGENSNENMIKFLKTNPSLDYTKIRFTEIFDNWTKKFGHLKSRHNVNRELAINTYKNGELKLSDLYDKDALVITLLNCCTGEIMTQFENTVDKHIPHIFKAFKKDISLLEELMSTITNLNDNNYLIVGNMPYVVTPIGKAMNLVLKKYNKKIKDIVLKHPHTYFFDKNMTAFLHYRDDLPAKMRFDFHPIIEIQYTMLYNYINYLMETIPLLCARKEYLEENNKNEKSIDKIAKKYHVLTKFSDTKFKENFIAFNNSFK